MRRWRRCDIVRGGATTYLVYFGVQGAHRARDHSARLGDDHHRFGKRMRLPLELDESFLVRTSSVDWIAEVGTIRMLIGLPSGFVDGLDHASELGVREVRFPGQGVLCVAAKQVVHPLGLFLVDSQGARGVPGQLRGFRFQVVLGRLGQR